jgi:hypothetical protein
MKRIVILATTLALASPAMAACSAADRLVDTYGISFSGFRKQLPKVPRPLEHGARTEDLVVIRLPNKKGEVPDGFIHSALIDKQSKQAWIRRKGSFVPVDEWYGPVKLETLDLEGCVVEAYR